MKIQILERQAVKVAYWRYTGPAGQPIGRFWRAIVVPQLADHGLLDCPRYGVAVDNPMNTAPEKCRYDACVELPRGLEISGVEQTTIPGGRYAVAHFKGTSAEIGAAWDEFIGTALSSHADSMDSGRPAFECYPRGACFDPKTGIFACELCLPLSP